MSEITAETQDLNDVPLGEDVPIDDEEYRRIMQRVMGDGDGADTDVCAFNSSI